MSTRGFFLALIQLKVGLNKAENVKRAIDKINQAAGRGSKVIALPECFNSPYGTNYFPEYAEKIPDGDTSLALSKCARENKIYLFGGSIPERDGTLVYNTCTVWGPDGSLLAKHRKVHLFDIDVKGGVKFKESETLTAGDSLTVVKTEFCKIGVGICYDVRFEEMARLYQKLGCEMIIYPGAFNMTTGPLHWDLLLRARAVDNQLYTAGIAPAQSEDAGYKSYGHTVLVGPWGNIIGQCEFKEDILYAGVDLTQVEEMRQQIPTVNQRRHDLYETLTKKNVQ